MRRSLVLFACLAACGSEAPGPSSGDAEKAIRDCFDAYKATVLDGDGEAAARLVAGETIEYYGKILALALDASAEETRSLPLMDKMTVLLMRALIDSKQLRAMTGRGLFIHAVNNGMIGKNSVIRIGLGEIVVSGTHATGEHLSAGQPSGIHWRFHFEDGSWRLDVVSILPAAALAFGEVIKSAGKTEDEFLADILTTLTGSRPKDQLWEPIGR